jgi:hypothetical protein
MSTPSHSAGTETLPPAEPTLRASLAVVARIFAVPILVLIFILSLAALVEGMRQLDLINGRFFSLVLIGCLGGIGGSVAAAQDGVLHFPYYDVVKRTIRLGSLQESMFGAVGAFAIFLVTPGISEQALKLGENAFADQSLGAEVARGADLSSDPAAADAGQDNAPSVDWIELIAIALIGGYAGRAIITRAMMLYVTKEDVENAKQEVRQESTAMVGEVQEELAQALVQRDIDHKTIKLFHDQSDIYSNPPPLDALLTSMKAASTWVLEDIYVEARRAFHSILSIADLTLDKSKAEDMKRRMAERMIPVMQCLCEADKDRKYRGSRYGLALALHLVGRHPEALAPVQEAILISQQTNRPIPPEYEELRQKLESVLKGQPGT